MLIPLLLLASATASCSVEAAQYRLRDDGTVTARFYRVRATEDWRTGLALRIHVGKSGRSYWFLPWKGGTNDQINLAWVREKNAYFQGQSLRQDMEYFETDRAYRFIHEVPKVGSPAPAHLLLPHLGEFAWYSTSHLQHDSIPKAFFDRIGCAAHDDDVRPEIEFPPVP